MTSPKPKNKGWLQVDSLHRIYWEEYGNPKGTPFFVLHGGPGDEIQHYLLELFDLKRHRVIFQDQRGSGRSKPSGEIRFNTTDHLLEDVRKLQDFFGIKKATFLGGSWGSTLALLYAQTYPLRVEKLVVSGIFLGRPEDDEWLFYGTRLFFPEFWEKFVQNIPVQERKNLIHAYYKRLKSTNRKTRHLFGMQLYEFMCRLCYLLPRKQTGRLNADKITASMLIFLHYSRNNYFLKKNQVLASMHTIRHIPGYIVHGRYDMDAPLVEAQSLATCWPKAKFQIVENAGHSQREAGIFKTLKEIVRNRF